MRIYFDTEFLEDGRTIELISIGLVKENGALYYAETPDARRLVWSEPWLAENVLPGLSGGATVKPHKRIAKEIVEFVGPDPEFWAYYASYDWIVLCQLYGRMIDLPKGWPMYCHDLKQEIDRRGLDIKQPESAEQHNALFDAEWLANTHRSILESDADYRDVFGRDPEPWREPLGALRLTLADDSAPPWQLQRARDECETLVKVLNRVPS